MRSGFLRLVRPASNAMVRRGGQSASMPSPSSITNVSGTVSLSVRPQSRALSTSQILSQSAASTMAAPEATLSPSAPAPATESSTGEKVKTALSTRPSEEIMTEYNTRKSSSVLALADYEAFLSELADARDFNAAYSVFTDMSAAGIKPTSSVFGSLFRAGRRTLRAHELREVLGKPSTDEPEKRASLDQPERLPSSNYARMIELRRMMDADGVKLDTEFWDDCAQWLAYANNAGMLINLAMAQELAGTPPSIRYYNKMLYSLPRCGFRDRADMLFSRMVLTGLADEHSYTTRLGSLVYQGRFDEADALFSDLKAKFEPSAVSYNTIIHGLLSAQRIDKALEVLEEMKASAGSPPNSITASTFLTSFYESGRLEHANAILQYFKEAINYPSDSMARAVLLKFYGRYDPAQASRLLQELVQAEPNFDAIIYNAIFNILADRRVHPDWKRLLGDIVIHDKTLPVRPGGLADLGVALPFHIRHLLIRMEAYGVKPDASTYELVMRSLAVRQDFATIIKIYEQMHYREMFSSHHNFYLSALMLSGASAETVNKFLVEMRLRRYPISSANHRRIVDMGFNLPAGAFVYTTDRAGSRADQNATATSFNASAQ